MVFTASCASPCRTVLLVQELALANSLGLALESAPTQAHLLHVVTVSHRAMAAGVLQNFPNLGSPIEF